MSELHDKVEKRFAELGLDHEVMLKGQLYSKPLNYWDYIELETLLSLQKPRTVLTDETVFIVYHQVTELVLKLILHELKQLCSGKITDGFTLTEKVGRMVRYTDLLIDSFSVMNDGMRYEDYNRFRLALAPASGFQSVTFRTIEIMSTDVDMLIPDHQKEKMPEIISIRNKFKYVYWQEAGTNHQTGKKSYTLQDFEDKYLDDLMRLAEKIQLDNLYQRFKSIFRNKENRELIEARAAMRAFDRNFNVNWPMVHLQTARTYLAARGEKTAATGGSDWEKYLHPKHQRRIFFPELWTEHELATWGEEYPELEE